MKTQKRYKHRVSWIEKGELKTKWFTSHVKAFSLYDDLQIRKVPVYYARKISNAFSAYQFDSVQSANDFGKLLVSLKNNADAGSGKLH